MFNKNRLLCTLLRAGVVSRRIDHPIPFFMVWLILTRVSDFIETFQDKILHFCPLRSTECKYLFLVSQKYFNFLPNKNFGSQVLRSSHQFDQLFELSYLFFSSLKLFVSTHHYSEPLQAYI